MIGLLARLLVGINPLAFFSKARALMITAFSTSSSNATLPTTIRTATEKFGVPTEIAGFVLPLGATMNMNGTALFEGVAVLSPGPGLRHSSGPGLPGDRGGPGRDHRGGRGGGTQRVDPLLVMVLNTVGVPGEGIALAWASTGSWTGAVPNVTGDLLTSLWITKTEGLSFVPREPEAGAPL